ncbi:hypothetical protein ACH5RR_000827 [Cinchona calisaya]|uniref:Uncharacterized protein n=1 Tax=Cinchona calisaya TaxID=153742 RepID=A0ABD3B210_9GENT
MAVCKSKDYPTQMHSHKSTRKAKAGSVNEIEQASGDDRKPKGPVRRYLDVSHPDSEMSSMLSNKCQLTRKISRRAQGKGLGNGAGKKVGRRAKYQCSETVVRIDGQIATREHKSSLMAGEYIQAQVINCYAAFLTERDRRKSGTTTKNVWCLIGLV